MYYGKVNVLMVLILRISAIKTYYYIIRKQGFLYRLSLLKRKRAWQMQTF